MATLYKRPGSDQWWIRYTKDGRQIRKSTGTEEKDKAIIQLREIELLLGQRKADGTVSQKLVKAIQQESIRPTPITSVFESRLKHVGHKTRTTYESRDKIFLAWLTGRYPHVMLISDINHAMIKAFMDEIADKHSARTFNGYLRRLRSVFRSAVKDGLCVEEPTVGIDFMPENESTRRAYTEEELAALFRAATGEVRLLAMLGLYAGAMRLSDIISLSWANIDLKKDVIYWRMSKRHGKPMQIAIHSRLKQELLQIDDRKSDNPVLPRFYKKPDRASEFFRQALVAAKLKRDNRPEINKRHTEMLKAKSKAEKEGKIYVPETVKRSKAELDFHSLRYNFVSILKSNGCPEAIARSIMGHASVEVSAIYTQIDAESEKKWVTSLPDVVGTGGGLVL